MLHVSPAKFPWLALAETNSKPDGNTSFTVMLSARLGPLLLTLSVKVITSFADGFSLLTVLVIAKSAPSAAFTTTNAVLFAVIGSNSLAALMVAVLRINPLLFTFAVRVSDWLAPTANEGTLQRAPLKEPPVTVASTNVRSAGNRSSTIIPEALRGPLFVSVIVKTTFPPMLGVAVFADFVKAKSAPIGELTVADEVLLAEIGSNTSLAEMDAVFTIAPDARTCAAMVKITFSPLATVPMFQTPLVKAPRAGEVVTKSKPLGKRSVTATPPALSGPLFVTSTV